MVYFFFSGLLFQFEYATKENELAMPSVRSTLLTSKPMAHLQLLVEFPCIATEQQTYANKY